MKEPIFYKLVRPIIKGFVFIVFHPTIIGKENIPKGRVVLAGNHTNNLDCLLLIACTKRCIHFLAKDSLYKGLKKLIFKNMAIIPVNRKIHDKSVFENANKVLSNDKVIGIFPEGTINRTSDIIMPFKIGAVKMASDTNSYIVPFTITGSYKLFNNNLKIEFKEAYKLSSSDLEEENKKLMHIIEDGIIKNRRM